MLWNNYRYKIENGSAVILEYTGQESAVRIPEQIEGYPVTEIGTEAFSEHGTQIETIEVPQTVKKIGDFAFKMCMSLSELILQEGVESIGRSILYVTSVTRLHIPASVRTIELPWELGDISWEVEADNPFYKTDGYALYEVNENGKRLVAVQKQDERREYHVEDGTMRIGRNAFEGQMYLQKLILPDSVRVVEEEAFESCSGLREIFLPEGIEVIESDAFRYCVQLREVVLPSTLRVLGSRALTDTFGWSDKMNGISRISIRGENPIFETDENAFYKKEEDQTITLEKYFGRDRDYTVDPKVTRIGEYAFRRANVRNLVIPKSVKGIQKDAFRECKNLESIMIEPDEVCLYIPKTPVYRKDEVTRLFCEKRDPWLYHYPKYDALQKNWSQMEERCRMACFRLKYPVELTSKKQTEYRELILEHMTDVLVDIGNREDIGYLSDLSDLGFFTDENIDEAIEVLNQCRKAKPLGFLMNYKQEHLGTSEFDFSL